MCVRVYALRIVSRDKVLRFKNILIINYYNGEQLANNYEEEGKKMKRFKKPDIYTWAVESQ